MWYSNIFHFVCFYLFKYHFSVLCMWGPHAYADAGLAMSLIFKIQCINKTLGSI